MLAFAGVKTPGYMEGKSFKSICETGKEPNGWKQAAYYRYWMHMAHHDNPGHLGIRTKQYKLIYYYGADYTGSKQTPPAWELYNLENDPHETVNHYHNPEYAPVVDKLKAQLAELRKTVNDDGSHYPQCEAVIQQFWDYDAADREAAKKLSAVFLKERIEMLKNPPKKKKPPQKKK